MTAMTWLPLPADFRQSLKSAQAASQPEQRLELLAALAQCRLGFVETIQVDKAIGTVAGPLAGFTRLRLAIVAASTVDHLLPAIRVAGLRRRLLFDCYVGSFGQYRQELMDPASGLRAFEPDLVLVSLGHRDLLGAVPLAASAAEAQQHLDLAVQDLRALWRRIREDFKAIAIQQTVLDVTEPLFGSYESLVPGSPGRLVARLNEQLAAASAEDRVLLLDVTRPSARDGIDAWHDVTRWLQAKIEIAPRAAPLYGELLARLVAAQRGLSRKCLVLDLDNTLWGGVVGDVGLDGIVLGQGSAAGEAHLALQRYARSLADRGIILAVCSKNDPAVVEEVFRDHPEMLLKRADIAAFVANWTDKAENLQAIASTLNIGLDSLVFVDDNPAERQRIRASLPMIAVPELPDDPAHYVRCVADAGYFEAIGFTAEDRQRNEQYTANNQREALRASAQSMDDFLSGLDMTVVFGPVGSVDLPRVTQLINKTNQFNTTTRRYSSEEVQALAGAPDNIMLQFRLIDRLGDNGLVSVMILCPCRDDPGVLEVVNWVMSCRVFGRQLEHEAMNIAVDAARARGIRALNADFIATKKNAVIRDLYGDLGFSLSTAPQSADTSRWSIELDNYVPRPTYITRRAQT